MTCDALQAVHESLSLEEARSTPVEIDHALMLGRLVGFIHRSAQQLRFEHSKLVSLPQPDHHREIWKTKHALIAFHRRSRRLLDSSQQVRLSIDVGFQVFRSTKSGASRAGHCPAGCGLVLSTDLRKP